MTSETTIGSQRYVRPGWFTRHIVNRPIGLLARRGLSLAGSRVLEVPGRSTGVIRSTVVNLLDHDGEQFLVAPRGVTEWVRNVRAGGEVHLRLGRHRHHVDLIELPDSDRAAKVDVIRAYLRRWGWEVGAFFDDLDASSSDEAIAAAAEGFPVFRVVHTP